MLAWHNIEETENLIYNVFYYLQVWNPFQNVQKNSNIIIYLFTFWEKSIWSFENGPMRYFLFLKPSSILILKMCSYFFNFTEVINNFIYFGPNLFGYFLTLNHWQTDILPYKLSIYHTSAGISLQLIPSFVYSVTKNQNI